MDGNSVSHAGWKCQYHIVFIPKYRRKVMDGKVEEDARGDPANMNMPGFLPGKMGGYVANTGQMAYNTNWPNEADAGQRGVDLKGEPHEIFRYALQQTRSQGGHSEDSGPDGTAQKREELRRSPVGLPRV